MSDKNVFDVVSDDMKRAGVVVMVVKEGRFLFYLDYQVTSKILLDRLD